MPDLNFWEWLGVILGAAFWLLSLFDPPDAEGVRIGRVWAFWRRW